VGIPIRGSTARLPKKKASKKNREGCWPGYYQRGERPRADVKKGLRAVK